jgi:hypothetical protein
MTSAWTLGWPGDDLNGGYEVAVRVPGNAKAPGGYIFPTREAAEQHARSHADARRYRPYEVELPGPYEECATRDWKVAHQARHRWHQSDDPTGRDPAVSYMSACAICNVNHAAAMEAWEADHDLLTVSAPFVIPND